ncbi:MAG: hypothetical protein U5J83_07535 [Bryobacterales bacterium]|nr:hypothetical protein [Bryobacterales bacterium]
MSNRSFKLDFSRREILAGAAVATLGCGVRDVQAATPAARSLGSIELVGGLKVEKAPSPLGDATWCIAANEGDGFLLRVPEGLLAQVKGLHADLFLDGNHMVSWLMEFLEKGSDRAFQFRFAALNQCSFRVRLPLSAMDLNRWRFEREGAWLKPMTGGARVDPAKVDRIRCTVERKSQAPARWSMTEWYGVAEMPPLLTKPALPKGPLLDELGQSRIHSWPGKTKSVEECVGRIRSQVKAAGSFAWPKEFTRWGGSRPLKLREGARFFGKHHDGKRWWLTDPDGHAFWSTGLDCVRVDATSAIGGLEAALAWLPPRTGDFQDAFTEGDGGRNGFTYLAANFIRAFGPRDWRKNWAAAAIGELKRLRFNTVGNWSDWEYAIEAQTPYVRPLSFNPKRVSLLYRDFPDIFDSRFADDAAGYADTLGSTRDDPAFIGYFLMNEPTWGFSSELPAVGMMYQAADCASRKELARTLGRKYADASTLSSAWGVETSFEEVASGQWRKPLPPGALKDLEEFSTRMVEHYFRTLSEACKRVDSNHLNLGMRWAGVPPSWALAGMKYFDVYSINNYREQVPRETTEEIQRLLNMPTIIGEWHFGALDVGLPASGIGHVRTQRDRGRAYRWYIEDAMANPNCVGAHWFTLYDQSAIGRYDGENYNIGFLDVCHRTYEEIGQAATASHEQMYALGGGTARPFADPPEYLPKLFI